MGKGTNYFFKKQLFLGPLLSYGYILLEIWDTFQGFLLMVMPLTEYISLGLFYFVFFSS